MSQTTAACTSVGSSLPLRRPPKLEGKIDRDDNTVRIDIRAVASEKGYPRMPLLYLYDAHVTDLPPGTYELRVTHEGDIFQSDKKERVTTMLQKTVEVQ